MIDYACLGAIGQLVCTGCGSPRLSHSGRLGHDADRSSMKFAFDLQQQLEPREVALAHRPTISFDDWLAALWLNCFPPFVLANFPLSSPCASCQQPPRFTFTLRFTCTPPIIILNVADWDLQTNAFLTLTLVMVDGTPKTYRAAKLVKTIRAVSVSDDDGLQSLDSCAYSPPRETAAVHSSDCKRQASRSAILGHVCTIKSRGLTRHSGSPLTTFKG